MASSIPFGVSPPGSPTPLVPTKPPGFNPWTGQGGGDPSKSFDAASNPDNIAFGISQSAGQTFGEGAGLVSKAGAALDPYLKNLEKIYGGDRAAVLEAAAPEVATVTSQYDTAFKAAQNNLTRGGGRNAVEADIPFKKASAIEGVLQGEKQKAGEEIGKTATALTQIGLSAEQGGTQALTSIFSAALQNNSSFLGDIFGALGDIGSTLIESWPALTAG